MTYSATTPSFFHFGFASTTFFSVTGSGNSITIGLIDISTFQNTANRLPYNLVSQSHTNIRDFKLRGRSSRLLQDVLGQPINSQSTEQDDLAGGLAHLPDFFLFLALPPGLVDRVNVLVRELDVADAEVASQSVGSRRGGHDDGAECRCRMSKFQRLRREFVLYERITLDLPLGPAPSQQNLLGLQTQSLGDLIDRLVDRSTLTTGERDQNRIALEGNVMVVLEIDQGLGRGRDVGVVQN